MPHAPPPRSPPSRSFPLGAAILALVGFGAAAGVWMLAAELAIGWRLLLALVIAGPFMLLGDLLRDKTAAPPGARPLPPDEERSAPRRG